MNTAEDSDPLDKLLGRREFGEQADVLRHAVLAQTVPVLWWRRFARRCRWTIVLAGCYLAGAASFGIWSLEGRPTAPLVATNAGDKDLTPDNSGRPSTTAQQPSLAESQATERTKSRFEALRDAGARALREQSDLEMAIRFYAQALTVATSDELTISVTNDDWLLMSLKDAHKKESGYADNNGES
jgi:HAMP domain-containing protein